MLARLPSERHFEVVFTLWFDRQCQTRAGSSAGQQTVGCFSPLPGDGVAIEVRELDQIVRLLTRLSVLSNGVRAGDCVRDDGDRECIFQKAGLSGRKHGLPH